MTTTPAAAPKETPPPQPRTWAPIIAGILIIIAGIVSLVAEIIYQISGDLGIFAGMPWVGSTANPGWLLFVTGVIAIAGGIFALLRESWWVAVVGVVFSMFFTIWPILAAGIISIFLLSISQKEFKRAAK